MPNIALYDPATDDGVTPQTGSVYQAAAASGGAGASAGALGMGGTGFTASGVGGAIGAVGSAVGDVYSSIADNASAAEYDAAAKVALQNKAVTQGSLITQLAQAQRQFNLTQGAQTTQIAAAGFKPTSSTAQALATAGGEQFTVNTNTITSNNYLQQEAYQQQATADENAAKAAKAAAGGSLLGAGFSAISAIASIAMMA